MSEVLLELENRGLIAKKGSAYAVTRLSEEEYEDLTTMRVLREPVACRLTAEHWSAEIGIELEDCLERMRAAFEERDFVVSWQCDREFHRIIWEYRLNRVLESHLDRIIRQLFAFYLSQSYAEIYYPQAPCERTLREHQLILDVQRTRDGGRVERVVRRLLDRSSRKASTVLRRIWRNEPRASSRGWDKR